MNLPPLRCALFGVGRFGKNYLRLLQSLEGFSLAAVVTAHEHPEIAITNSSVRTITNSRDVFNDPSVAAVIIVTPAHTHFDFACQALEAGKHVLIEKPMVMRSMEADLLVKIAAEWKRVCMVSSQYLFNNRIEFIKSELDAGRLGAITEIVSEHLLSPPREDINCFYDAAPHPLSIYQYLFSPTKIVRVSGTAKRIKSAGQDDFLEATVTFDRGPLLTITTSWLGAVKTRRISFVSDTARITLDETDMEHPLTIVGGSPVHTPPKSIEEPLAKQLLHFKKCIETNTTPLTDVTFGAKITSWLETINAGVTR